MAISLHAVIISLPCEHNGLGVAATAVRRRYFYYRQGWHVVFSKHCNFVTVGQILKNVTSRIETILHVVLMFQVDRACFHVLEKSASKVRLESGIRGRGKKERKKKERIEHPQ